MKRLLVLLFCFSSAFGYPKVHLRHVGGEVAAEGQFPYHASVRFFDSPACGGSIIGQNTVLIGARCLMGQPISLNRITVVTGSNKFSDGTTYKVTKIYAHPKFDPANSLEFCLGIVKVTPAFIYSNSIQPIKLANTPIGDNQNVVTTGFGFYKEQPDTFPSEKLKFIKASTLNLKECKEQMGELSEWVYDSSICMISNGNSGYCIGDWGGALINEDGDLVGVISFNDCPGFKHPDVYTNVVTHTEWIEEQLKL